MYRRTVHNNEADVKDSPKGYAARVKAPWVKISIAKLGALRNVKKLGVTIERGKKR